MVEWDSSGDSWVTAGFMAGFNVTAVCRLCEVANRFAWTTVWLRWCDSGHIANADSCLGDEVSLRIARLALHAAEPEDRAKCLVIPPPSFDLRTKRLVQDIDLLLYDRLIEGDVVGNASEVAIPFGYFVMEDESSSPDG